MVLYFEVGVAALVAKNSLLAVEVISKKEHVLRIIECDICLSLVGLLLALSQHLNNKLFVREDALDGPLNPFAWLFSRNFGILFLNTNLSLLDDFLLILRHPLLR